MVEYNSIEHNFHKSSNMYPNISNDQKYRLNKINVIEEYFIAEIGERELMSKNLSKYIVSFDDFYKSLIISSVSTGSISIASSAAAIAGPVGIMSANCSLAFPVTTGFVKKFLKTIRNKNQKNTIKFSS